MSDSKALILVVDDVEESASTLAELLHLAGYEAEVAFNAADALSAIKRRTPAVAILDLDMPGMSGLKLAEEIRRSFPADCMRLLALTGSNEKRQTSRARKCGFDYFFSKPANMEELLFFVKVAISRVKGLQVAT